MPTLYGKSLTRAELTERGGDIRQFAGVRLGELGDGFERGVRTVDFRTGSGLDFTVLADRGLDIGAANFNGAALAWQSPTSYAHPAFYGAGRARLAARLRRRADDHVRADLLWRAERGRGAAVGAARPGVQPGGHASGLRRGLARRRVRAVGQRPDPGSALLRRERGAAPAHSAWLGSSRLVVEDAVTNEGYDTTPHMMLYHCNLGYPVLSEDSELLIDDAEVFARDEICAAGLPGHRRFARPCRATPSRCSSTSHKRMLRASPASAVNRTFDGGRGLGAYLRWHAAELPWMIQWKQIGQGAYVAGLEPATNWTIGRAAEQRCGPAEVPRAGRERNYRLELGVLASRAEIDAFAAGLSR